MTLDPITGYAVLPALTWCLGAITTFAATRRRRPTTTANDIAEALATEARRVQREDDELYAHRGVGGSR